MSERGRHQHGESFEDRAVSLTREIQRRIEMARALHCSQEIMEALYGAEAALIRIWGSLYLRRKDVLATKEILKEDQENREEIKMSKLITAEEAVDILVGEGFDRADVIAVIDSMIDAGEFQLPQPDDGWIFTLGELDLARDQLRS